MRSRVVLVGLTGSAADTRVHCGGLSAGWCYTDGIGAPLPSTFIATFTLESLKVLAPRIKLAKVRCAPHRSQKGHRSAGGANVLKLVGRGARTKTAKVLRTPYVKDPPVFPPGCEPHARQMSWRVRRPSLAGE